LECSLLLSFRRAWRPSTNVFPKVEIGIAELGFGEQIAALLGGKIHLGFQARNAYTLVDKRLKERTVLACGLKVLLSSAHRLVGESELSVSSLQREKLIHYEPRPEAGYDRWVREFCQYEGGFNPQFVQPPAANIEGGFGLVAAGEGVFILADVVATGVAERKGLIVRKLVSRPPQFQVAAVWNPLNPSVALSNYLAVLDGIVGHAKKASPKTKMSGDASQAIR
jgi:DNA-binding transcriptional LysR family regulator